MALISLVVHLLLLVVVNGIGECWIPTANPPPFPILRSHQHHSSLPPPPSYSAPPPPRAPPVGVSGVTASPPPPLSAPPPEYSSGSGSDSGSGSGSGSGSSPSSATASSPAQGPAASSSDSYISGANSSSTIISSSSPPPPAAANGNVPTQVVIQGSVYCQKCSSKHLRYRGIPKATVELSCPQIKLRTITGHHGKFKMEFRHTMLMGFSQNCTVSLDYSTLPASCNTPTTAEYGSSSHVPIFAYFTYHQVLYVVPSFTVKPSTC